MTKVLSYGLLTCLMLDTVGCGSVERIASPERTTRPTGVRSYTIKVPSYEAESILNSLDAAIDRDDAEKVIAAVDVIVAGGLPSNIAFMVAHCERWVENHPESGRWIAAHLVNRREPVARWAGLRVAENAGLESLFRDNLRDNVGSLLLRPDPVPWWIPTWWFADQGWFRRLDRAGNVAELRAQIIDLMGRYKVREATPILHMIMRDSSEWYPRTKEVASQALAAIEGTGPE